MHPAQYWRTNKQWKNWIGKRGRVVACTVVHTPPPEYEMSAPYHLALVEFSNQKKLFMAPPSLTIEVGQEVEVVLRKGGHTSRESIIEYQLKIIPILS